MGRGLMPSSYFRAGRTVLLSQHQQSQGRFHNRANSPEGPVTVDPLPAPVFRRRGECPMYNVSLSNEKVVSLVRGHIPLPLGCPLTT